MRNFKPFEISKGCGQSQGECDQQAELIRTNKDLTQSYFTINLAEAIAGNEGKNDASKRDQLTIYTLDDIRH